MFHLPVNGRYAMVQEGNNSSNVSFNYSSVGSPASFTRVAITPTLASGGYTFVSVLGSTVFEDTDGTIYVTMAARISNSKNQQEIWSLAYISTNGGASFTGTSTTYNGMYAPLVIAKNLQ